MATIRAGLTDNSAKDNTGDLINGSEVDANPQNLANILDGTVSTALAQSGALVFGADGAGTDITTHGASAGAQMLWDASANTLEVRGATAEGPGVIKLQTGELTNVNDGILGRLEFQAPLDSAGTDAILVGASIWAEVDDTFASGLNDTDLVFAVAESEAALERMRLAWDGTTTNLHFAQIANISSTADITLTAVGDVNIPADIGLTFGDDGEKIEGDGTNLTIASSGLLTLTATGNTVITNNALVSGTLTAAAGSFTTLTGSGILSVDDTTEASSTTVASIHTDGGVGIAKDLILSSTSEIFVGDTENTKMTAGITLNQGGADNEIFALKSSDVGHGMTDDAEADTYFTIQKAEDTSGGALITSWKDPDGVKGRSLNFRAVLGETADTTKSTAAIGVEHHTHHVLSGSSITSTGVDANMAVWGNGNGTARFIFDAEGTGHADVAWDTYSDRRLKSNFALIPYGLAEVLALNPQVFDKESGYINDADEVVLEGNKRRMVGLVAQDVKALMPLLIKDLSNDKSFYTMDYGRLTPVLVKAVQELEARLQLLEAA